MNQGNHWPLGSRLLSSEEASAALAKSIRDLDVSSSADIAASSSGTYGQLSSELRSNKKEPINRANQPINWLGRP